MMVAREGLYNTPLHGDPKKITTDLRFTADELLLSISANGLGFDATARPAHPHSCDTPFAHRL